MSLRRRLAAVIFAFVGLAVAAWINNIGAADYTEMFFKHTAFKARGVLKPDLRSRLLQLKDQLWRACRVIVDVGLHTGKMSFNDAVNFMVKEAKLERVNAVTEVRRYCQTPTQPMSYMLGKLQILALLDDYKKKHGAKFNLRKFHDELLSHGTIPVKYVRMLMGL